MVRRHPGYMGLGSWHRQTPLTLQLHQIRLLNAIPESAVLVVACSNCRTGILRQFDKRTNSQLTKQ